VLITPEQAQGVIDRFRGAYPKLGKPRLLFFVNRELVDESADMKIAGGTAVTKSKRETVTIPQPNAPGVSNHTTLTTGSEAIRTNTYRTQDRVAMTLADKQTVRDVERLFGRPFRLAGAALADQRVATQLIGDKPIQAAATALEGEPARKDREALAQIADVVIEVLISSRNVTVPEVSGDQVYSAPDIQATAIRLRDARILGQATAADIVGKNRYAGRVWRNFDVRDLAEATALSLMEDMLLNLPAETEKP